MAAQQFTITANGVTALPQIPEGKRKMTILASGTFGTGTLAFGYKDNSGTFIPFTTIASSITSAGEVLIDVGPGVGVAVSLSGATAPAIALIASV